MEKLNICPVCGVSNIKISDEITDHFLTGETFQLTRCNNCGFLFTNPRPKKTDLARYYQSEDYFSHSKKKKGLISFLYDSVKKYALYQKFRLISKYKKRGSILDVGCATGEFLHHFKNRGWKTLGIEPAEQPRKFAIDNYSLKVKSEESITVLKDESFDVITMWHVLEHVPELNQRMKEIRRLLKPDGLLLIALPNYLSWDGQHYKNFWAGYDVPRHLYHFTPDTISLLLEKFHFSVFKIIPMKFDAFYVSLLSEKYATGKLNYTKAFFNGIKSNRHAKKQGHNYSSLIYLAKKQNP